MIEQGHGTNIAQLDPTGQILPGVVQYRSLKLKSDARRQEVSMKLRPWRMKFEEDVEVVMATNYLNCRELNGVVRKIMQNITNN